MKPSLITILLFFLQIHSFSQNVFSVKGSKTYLNGNDFKVIGLRCSNALLSDETVGDLINHLDEYKSYGINTISVYFMGSRYSDINGFNLDATVNETYASRMSRIIRECDNRNMVVLVGVLYWGGTSTGSVNEYYAGWSQSDVNRAVRNTMFFLRDNNHRNVFVDPDNEAMAHRIMNYSLAEMICEAKEAVPNIPVAYNMHGPPSSCADLSIHFGNITLNMPYIQSEGTPSDYWGEYSKEQGLSHYINVGIYTEGKKNQQINNSRELLDDGHGYIFASTWLQNVPPNYNPGGNGSPCDPGIRWWLEFVKENYRPE